MAVKYAWVLPRSGAKNGSARDRDRRGTMETREAEISKMPWNPAGIAHTSRIKDWALRAVIFLGWDICCM